MPSVQFRTAEDCISGFKSLDCKAWSLWDGKRFMFKGIGEDELEAWLDLMNESGGSNAVYTLGYHEGVTDKKDINNKTPYDGSFNFRLNSDRAEETRAAYSEHRSGNRLLESKVSGLEAKLDKVLEGMADGGEEHENKLGIIGEILEHRAIAPIVPQLVERIVSMVMGNGYQPPPPQQLGRVAGFDSQTFDSTKQHLTTNDSGLTAAINRLKQLDPKLPAHLKKLADIGDQDKTTFDYIISQLDRIPTQ